VIVAGTGSPYMAGGAGADTFVIGPGRVGADTIGDFEPGVDRLELRGFTPPEVSVEAHSHDGSDGQILSFVGGGHVWLPGVTDASSIGLVFA
jgi:Ca2+-binding RTX toxin-like protein